MSGNNLVVSWQKHSKTAFFWCQSQQVLFDASRIAIAERLPALMASSSLPQRKLI